MVRTPEKRFERVIEGQVARPEVSVGRMFGSPVLKVGGRVLSRWHS